MAHETKQSAQKHTDPLAYILCYTIRVEKENNRGPNTNVDTDNFEVFCEFDENENSPAQQAENRLSELRAVYEDENSKAELYTWNIAAVTQTNEHYKTGIATEFLEFIPDAVPDAWNNVEVEAIAIVDDKGSCEPVYGPDARIDFYSVYLHNVEGGVQCVADVPDEATANKLASLIEKAVANHIKTENWERNHK